MGEEATTTTTDATSTETTSSAGSGDPGATTTATTFSQDDVNRIVEDRLARERKKLGGLSFDEVVSRLGKLDELEEATKTELERAVEKARKDAADEATKTVEEKWKARAIRAEVRSLAAGKLTDPEDAVRFLELDKLELDDDGNVDEEKVGKMLDELLKTKPYLAANGTRRTVDFDAGSRTPAPTGGDSVNDRIRRAAGVVT